MKPKINFTNIMEVSLSLDYAFRRNLKNVYLEATCASGDTVEAEYFRFVVLTQRIVVKDRIVGYVCYRIKRPRKHEHVVFSSYEVFNSDFDRSTSTKIHVQPDPESAFRSIYKIIAEKTKKGA